MCPDDLDEFDRALKALPAPRAPRTLLPRVMAAVDARGAVSKPRPWLAWPLAWQLASAALVLVLAIGVVQVWPTAQAAIGRAATSVMTSVTTQFGGLVEGTSVVVTLAGTFWRLLLQPLSGYALALVLVMGAACATFGAALSRVALGGHP